jgi:hypothetical protein
MPTPSRSKRRNLITQRLAAAGGHQYQAILSRAELLDDLLLRPTEGVEAEHAAEQIVRRRRRHCESVRIQKQAAHCRAPHPPAGELRGTAPVAEATSRATDSQPSALHFGHANHAVFSAESATAERTARRAAARAVQQHCYGDRGVAGQRRTLGGHGSTLPHAPHQGRAIGGGCRSFGAAA